MNKLMKSQRGSFLVAAIVMILFLTAIGISISGLISAQYQHTKLQTFTQNAELVAEAGIEQSVHQLNSNNNFTGYGTPQQLFSNSTQGKGTFTTAITNNSDGKSKTIISNANVYRLTTDAQPYVTRSLKVVVVGTASSGYSVYTGPGGLILSGAASINNADVYVNGTITMSGASRIGSDLIPSNVYVANDACPTGSSPGSTYPTVCTSTQPISMPNWGTTSIIGTVCATGQTQSAFPTSDPIPQIRGGLLGGSGLQSGCTAPPATTPTYDRATQIGAVTTTASGNSNSYVCNSWPFNRTWPANLELTGNVSIGGACKVDITGNVYITGNLTLDGAAAVSIDNSVGTNRPVIIVDGTITVGGAAVLISNNNGTGAEFISFKSTNNCTTTVAGCVLTGNDLKSSQSLQTVSIGGGVSFPGMIFDAYWGEITISGSGNVGAAIGQTVNMSGAGSIIFGTGLASGSKTWTISSYQPVYH